MGSEKHIWNTLSLLAMTSGEEAEGVRAKIRSSKLYWEVAMPGWVVTEPREICMPQSFRLL